MSTPARNPGTAAGRAHERRVVILGDSWIRGLGLERRASIGKLVAQGVDATRILDLTAISRTTPDVAENHLADIAEFAPDIAVVNVGGADSLIFPAWRIQRFIDRFAPPKWHGVEGLMPIARYSDNRRRRRQQRLETAAKIVLKQLVVNLFGGRRRVSLTDFETSARTVLAHLHRIGAFMIVVGLPAVDPLLSPKTNRSARATNAVLMRLCEEIPGALWVPTAGVPRRWGDYLSDHVHLSASGHRRVADHILSAVALQPTPWRAAPVEVGT